MDFKLHSDFDPKGDQPKAIKKLHKGLKKGYDKQTLLGVTGSGKTFTMANVIEKYNRPSIVIAHNKTLAFQLYNELLEFFPKNRVEFFISYYDYYQPESYVPNTDTYIEKDAQVNSEIEKMRQSATANLLSRDDVIIVASVSAIYGLGKPENYKDLSLSLKKSQKKKRKKLMEKLLEMQYERNDTELVPGRFRVRGRIIDLIPSYQNEIIRIQIFNGKIKSIKELSNPNYKVISEYNKIHVFPASHFASKDERVKKVTEKIKDELDEWLPKLKEENELYAHRLKQKINYDIEMMEEVGYCKGVENYSRYFDGRKPGERPYCLLDYFPDDFLMFIDESHQTIPQIHGMYKGDRSRKQNLVDYGFRLPSALDNRPLKFNEFKQFMNNVIFVSATPGDYERKISNQIVEQINRPTGLVDPKIEIQPIEGQIEHLIKEIRKTEEKGFRTLVTTLTKRLSEELTNYLSKKGIKVRYLHSEIDSIERTELIRQLRLKKFDVLVGINLLREGLDIPEVGLVAITDADKEGFLRDSRSLIQTIGRASRNSESKVILYADRETKSLKRAVNETERRRKIQINYNKENNITPKTIKKPIKEQKVEITDEKGLPEDDIPGFIANLESEMRKAADNLNFERAMKLKDRVKELKEEYNVD